MGIPETNISRDKAISEDVTVGMTAQDDFFVMNTYDDEAVLMTRVEAETLVIELTALLRQEQ